MKYLYYTFLSFLLPIAAFAQDTDGRLDNPLKNDSTLVELLNSIVGILVTIGTPVIVLMLIYSGFLFVKAQGKPDDLKTAKNALTWTVIGAMVLLGAEILSNAITQTITDIRG